MRISSSKIIIISFAFFTFLQIIVLNKVIGF